MRSQLPGPGPKGPTNEWKTIKTLLPYLWPEGETGLRIRVVAALILLAAAKGTNVAVPIFYKQAVDSLTTGGPAAGTVIAVPIALLIFYGLARIMAQAFGELRDAVFTRVAQRAIRLAGLRTFRHLHRLSLRFHLERKTGGVSRAVERGTKGIEFLLRFMLFNVLPTVLEVAMVCGILWYLLCGANICNLDRLHPVDARHHRMAPKIPPHHERNGQRSQHQGHRQPAQF